VGSDEPDDLALVKYRVAGISNVTPITGESAGGLRNGSNTSPRRSSQPRAGISSRVRRILPGARHRQRQPVLRRVIVLGDKARTDLKLPEDCIGTFIQLGREWFKIVGLMEARGEMFGNSMDNYAIIPFETGRALTASPYNEPDMAVLLTVDNLDAVEDVKNRIAVQLRRAHKIGPGDDDDFKIESSQTVTETIQRVSGQITLVISAVVGISLLVGGVGIMNIMLVSVTERTREIGIAKALGAPRRFILMQFLIEAMLLAVIGGIIGICFGWLLGELAAKLIPHFPPPVVPWWAIVGATGFSALVGMLFGILPARRAANLAPIDALRHE
jgi:putative ABC transport system permease protein